MKTEDRAVIVQAKAYHDYIHASPEMQNIYRSKLNDANEEMRRIKRLIDKGVKVP